MFLVATAMIAATGDLPRIQGTKLAAGEACFSVLRNGTSIGQTWQRISATLADGRPAWDIVIHQRVPAIHFDMRDHFVVLRSDLSPVSLDSQRGAAVSDRGWQRISIRYRSDRIEGTRETATGKSPISVVLDHKVWDGNLWGITFAALPLSTNAAFTLPSWQYDKGFGFFTVRVVGKERVQTPSGALEAWTVEAGDGPNELSHYLISTKPRAEIGYHTGPIEQRLGGSCVSLSESSGGVGD